MDILEFGALAAVLVLFGVIWFLQKKKKVDFGILTLLAVAFGILVGVAFKDKHTYYSLFGTVYTRLIGAVVVPLLIFSIISSITSLGEKVNLGKIGGKSILYLLLNTAIASSISLVLAVSFKIGNGFVYELATDYEAKAVPSFVDTLAALFPSNLAKHWASGEVVPIVIFTIIVALAYNVLAKNGNEEIRIFKKVIDAGNRIFAQVVEFIIGFTPYAVLSLIARAVSRNKVADLLPLLSVLVLVYALCAIQVFGVESLLLALIGKLNPIPFFKGILPAGIVAFTSQSSVGTLPVTTKQLKNDLGVSEEVASFVATLGANLGMPGCAGIWPVVLAVFAINILGIPYTLGQYLFLIVLAVVVSVGTVGVPGTATITATALFVSAGLPVEVIVLLSPISSIADMARTATNVIGAATATVLVAKTENELDEEVYRS